MKNKRKITCCHQNDDKHFLIKRIITLFFFVVFVFYIPDNLVVAQQLTVSGTVSDQQGAPLAGVTVMVKGTTVGTLTDANGKYSLSNVAPNATLVFSFVGMSTQEIPVNGRTSIDVKLIEVAIGLEEIVVVGYGTQTKKTLTGAVSNVTEEGLKTTAAPSLSQRIAGKIPGISTRITDGRPGSISAIQIRNYGTPLYIIDSVPRI